MKTMGCGVLREEYRYLRLATVRYGIGPVLDTSNTDDYG